MDRKETELDPRGAKALSRPETADSRTEALLQQGEELFESGHLERAVHLWTRVLFLDRGNREARGRIEQAKGLLAERQRLFEARVVEARRLFEEGELEPARKLLRSVLSVDARHPDAVRLSEDMATFDRRVGLTVDEPTDLMVESRSSERDAEPVVMRPSTAVNPASAPGGGLLLRVSRRRLHDGVSEQASTLKIAAFLLGVGIAFTTGGLLIYYNWESIVSDGTASGIATGAAGSTATNGGVFGVSEASPDVRQGPMAPDLAELRYYNGARLFDKGRYREALAELERVDRGSAVASRARSLILRIEERLLRGAEEPDAEEQER